MEIPKNAKVTEFPTSFIWIDEDGILYSKPKPGPQPKQSIEESKKTMDTFRTLTGGKKVCMILESASSTNPPNKEERDYIATELADVTKAMAIITTSPLSRMIANLFFGLKPPPYPVKMVANEIEGKEFLKQYCEPIKK